MAHYNWQDFLLQWERERAEIVAKMTDLSPHSIEQEAFSEEEELSLERNSQVEEDIRQLEERIGRPLPPSFRDFLVCHVKMASRLFDAAPDSVDWWREKEPSSWLAYNLEQIPDQTPAVGYGEVRKFDASDREALQDALLVASAYGHEGIVYLLNPMVVTEEGEWEAWSLSQRDLYITRFTSFWAMMQALYAEFRERAEGCRLAARYELAPVTQTPTPIYPWKELLTIWSRALLKPGVREEFYFYDENVEEDEEMAAMIEAEWIGYAPASVEEVEELEFRLETKLPPSYRQFLQASNGLNFHMGDLYQLWPVEEVQWYDEGLFLVEFGEGESDAEEEGESPDSSTHQESDIYESYRYNKNHLRASLEIGGYDGNDFYLLNPLVVTEDGEWEAWTKAKESGVERASSFWAMMQDTYFLYFVRDFPFT